MNDPLTKENAINGLVIICKDHPEWGNWTMKYNGFDWEITNRRGTKVLDESEFRFWSVK